MALREQSHQSYTSDVQPRLLPNPSVLVTVALVVAACIPSMGCQATQKSTATPKERRINGKLVIKYVSLPEETGSRLRRKGALLEDGSIVALDGSSLSQVDKAWLEQAKGRF